MRRHDECAFAAVTQLDDRPEDFGNDIAGLADDDRVANEDPLGLHDVLVVQRRLTYDAARDTRRFHNGERCRAAGSPDRNDDVEQLRVHLLGRVLVRNRPPRRAARRAQLVVQSQLIDFHDDTVDLVLDIVTVFAVVADVIGGGID